MPNHIIIIIHLYLILMIEITISSQLQSIVLILYTNNNYHIQISLFSENVFMDNNNLVSTFSTLWDLYFHFIG